MMVATKYRLILYISILCLFPVISCQKEIKFNSAYAPIKQVINSNFSPESNLYVNISKSKQPSDFNSIEFLNNCKVDLYEDGVFIETMPYTVSDTLSGLGWYISRYKLKQAKTYKIISAHPELGVASAEEYLPYRPFFTANLFQHADSVNDSKTGILSITFNDSALFKDYYYLSVYYRILKPVINPTTGDTTYKTDYIFNIPATSTEAPNPINYSRTLFSDNNFDGQNKTMTFTFQSTYSVVNKKIDLIVEFAALGFNFYDWTMQQLKPAYSNLNEGPEEPSNLVSNIQNGYGHFSAYSSRTVDIKIR